MWHRLSRIFRNLAPVTLTLELWPWHLISVILRPCSITLPSIQMIHWRFQLLFVYTQFGNIHIAIFPDMQDQNCISTSEQCKIFTKDADHTLQREVTCVWNPIENVLSRNIRSFPKGDNSHKNRQKILSIKSSWLVPSP